MKNPIWMCWFQGEEHIAGSNKICVDRWKELNKDRECIILNQNTIKDYVPEYEEILNTNTKSRGRRMAARSDLLRILLLNKFGGTWVDASVYPVQPLSDFYDNIVNETGFFAYRFIPRGGYFEAKRRRSCETASWFLTVNKPNHYLINKWKESFIERIINRKGHWYYYTFHAALTRLYDSDPKIKYIIDNMVQINEKIPHSASTFLNAPHMKAIAFKKNFQKGSYMYKRPNIKLLTQEMKLGLSSFLDNPDRL